MIKSASDSYLPDNASYVPRSGASVEETDRVDLIRFDKKSLFFIGVNLIFFLLFVAFKLHNSSIPVWNANIVDGGDMNRGLVAGRAIPARSDEWLVVTSFILAQEKDNFPVSNEGLGYGKTPLIMGLPTSHILSKAKPALWGYYLLDIERGFSWQWNFKIFPFLISSFLLLMLFTRNNFTVSIFGSCWLFLSSAVQWWSINTEILTFGFSSLVSLIYILYSTRARLIVLNGFLFFFSAYSFIMTIYPPYQVPFGYFLLALFIGYVVKRKNVKDVLNKRIVKLPVLAISGSLLLLFIFIFYKECKDTIQIVSDTVYPGRRQTSGGDFAFISMFRDNYSWFVGQNYFPPRWGNICELSSFLMLAPVSSALLVYSYLKTGKINSILATILIFHFIIYIWLFRGFPDFLAKVTLFGASPPGRTFYIFGVTNVILTTLYLGQSQTENGRSRIWYLKMISFCVIFLLSFGINYSLNKQSDKFFSIAQIFNATALYSALAWLIVYFKESKIYRSLFMGACLLFVGSNIFINPLSKGLAPYFENKIYITVLDMEKKDPQAGWMVFGNMLAADFLKAAGINCFNGVQYAPPLEKLQVLDSSHVSNDIYDRYAHINLLPLVNVQDSVRFSLNFPDNYTIQLDPSSPRLKRIGIKYIMFTYKPSDTEVRNLSPVKEISGFYIFKRKEL
jgi:hypothetical protein